MRRVATVRLAGLATAWLVGLSLLGCSSERKSPAERRPAQARPEQSAPGVSAIPGSAAESPAAPKLTRTDPEAAPERSPGGETANAMPSTSASSSTPSAVSAPAPSFSKAPDTTPLPKSRSIAKSLAPPTVAGEEVEESQTPPVAPVPSSTGDQGTGSSQTPWETPAAGTTSDYTTVTVFYGTDRKATRRSHARVEGYAGWFHLTALCALLTMVAAVGAMRRGRSGRLTIATGAGMTLTLVLGLVTTMARLESEEINPANHIGYGNDRGEVQVGTCEVSIPKYHEVGVVERPSIFRLEFSEDPRKHVVLLDVQQETPDEFYSALKAKVAASPRDEAFVFVHGYNVTFEDAARRTAQLAYDLKFEGAPIFFSWPSQGGLLQYAVDETNVAWAVPHLKEFLVSVARRSGAGSIHLIAHSMGNRALTSALLAVAADMKDEAPLFREVVLTAPDIDADVFRRDIAPFLTRSARRVTLYASSNDEALALSKRLHGYARAGDSGSQLVVVQGIDTIDVSNVDTSLVGHSYYGSNDTVLADLFYVLTDPQPAAQRRWLEAVPFGQSVYWVFQREAARLRAAAGGNASPR